MKILELGNFKDQYGYENADAIVGDKWLLSQVCKFKTKGHPGKAEYDYKLNKIKKGVEIKSQEDYTLEKHNDILENMVEEMTYDDVLLLERAGVIDRTKVYPKRGFDYKQNENGEFQVIWDRLSGLGEHFSLKNVLEKLSDLGEKSILQLKEEMLKEAEERAKALTEEEKMIETEEKDKTDE